MYCRTPEDKSLGVHGGAQWRSPRYFLLCGCDLGICENHAKALHRANPFGPKYEEGNPRKCRKCLKKEAR